MSAKPAKERAKRMVDEAQTDWKRALRAHRLAPPDPEFAKRLRALAASAGESRDAYAVALEAGLTWRPIPASSGPPYELRPRTGRRGPEELWERFDTAVKRLSAAARGHSLADLVAGYDAVAQGAGALADALEAGAE